MTERAGGGLFISFEGTEGSGKTTQLRLLAERLRARGFAVAINQEPGTTRIGGEIRRILLDPEHREMMPMTELLLMFASRAQGAAEIVLPALERGEIVLSDRFTDSTLAYQGEGRGLGFDPVHAAHRLALDGLYPDLTICIVLDIESGLARAVRRNPDESEARIDRQPLEFHKRVEAAYHKIAAEEPARFRVVDGSGEPEQVAERVWAEVEPLLEENKG
jgi:dTMP kinase